MADLFEEFGIEPEPPKGDIFDQFGETPSDFNTEPKQTILDEESGRVISAPIGTGPEEAIFFDRTDNRGEDKSKFYGFVDMGATAAKDTALGTFNAIQNFGRGAAATAISIPATLEASTRKQVAEARGETLERPFKASDLLAFIPNPFSVRDEVIRGATIDRLFQSREQIAGEVKEAAALDKSADRLIESNNRFLRRAGLTAPEEGGIQGFFFDLGGASTTIAASIGLSAITKNPTTAAILFGEIQKSSSYLEARDAGFSPEAADNISSFMGIVEGGLEFVGLSTFFKLSAKNKGAKLILLRAIEEGIQEGLQTGAEEIITQVAGIRELDIEGGFGRVGYSMMLGAVGGGGTASIIEVGKAIAKDEKLDLSDEQLINLALAMEQNKELYEAQLAKAMEQEASDLAKNPQAEKRVNAILNKFKEGGVIEVQKEIAESEQLTDDEKTEMLGVIAETQAQIEIQVEAEIKTGRIAELETQIEAVDTQIEAAVSKFDLATNELAQFDSAAEPKLPGTEDAKEQAEARAKLQSKVSKSVTQVNRLAAKRIKVDEELGGLLEQGVDVVRPARGIGVPARPQNIIEFLADRGGINTEELAGRDLDKAKGPGSQPIRNLIKETGLDLDAAREAAEEAGFLDEFSGLDDLINAIDSTLAGDSVFAQEDQGEVAEVIEAEEINEATARLNDVSEQVRDEILTTELPNLRRITADDLQAIAEEVIKREGVEVGEPEVIEDRRLEPFRDMTKEEFLGSPKIVSPKEAADLTPTNFKNTQDAPAEPFLDGKFEIRFGDKNAVVYDNGEPIASFWSEGLAVDKDFRKQGIGEELVYQVRTRNPDFPTAPTRNKTAQKIQEKVWQRIQNELEAQPEVVTQPAPQPEQSAIAEVIDELDGILGTVDNPATIPFRRLLETVGAREGFVPKKISGQKRVSVKAQRLRKLGVETTKQSIRAVQQGLRKGQRLAKTDTKLAQEAVIKVIDQSKLLAKDKAKFLKTIKNIKSTADAQKQLPLIASRINTLIQQQQRRELVGVVNKVLKRASKVKKQSGKAVGKFTAETQKVINELAKLNKLDQDSARELLEKRLADPDKLPDEQELMENVILSLKADLEGVSVDAVTQLALDIESVLEEGRTGAELRGLKKKRAAENAIGELIELIGDPVPLDPDQTLKRFQRTLKQSVANGFNAWSGVFRTRLQVIIESKDAAAVKEFLETQASLFEETRRFEAGKQEQVRKIDHAMRKITGLSHRKLVKKLLTDETEKIHLGTFTHSDGMRRELTFTRAELRKRWMELQDPALAEAMEHEKSNAYTEDIIKAIDNELSEQDIQIAQAQLDFYNQYYERINKTYSKLYGIDLPKVEFYSPIRRELATGDVDPFLQGILYQGGATPGSLKSRAPNVRPIAQIGDFTALMSHIQEMEYFIAYAEKVRHMSRVFKDPQVQRLIKDKAGKNMLEQINKDIDYFTNKGRDTGITGAKHIRAMVRNFGFAQLGAKPQIGAKQITSFPAFVSGVELVDFSLGLAELAKNPAKAMRIMQQSEFWQQRGINQDRDLMDIVGDKSALNFLGKHPGFADMIMLPIKFGDKGAIFIGGYAHYFAKKKALVKSGIPEAQAHKKAMRSWERLAANTQQSTDPDQLSELQRSNNVMARVLTQFMSSANALARAEYSAIVEFSKGRITKREFTKQIFTYHILIPNLFMLVSNGFSWDDEDQLRASVLGTMNGFFVFGQVIEAVVSTILTGDFFESDIRHPADFYTPLLKGVSGAIEEGMSFDDVMEAGSNIDDVLQGVSALTGVPIRTVYLELYGLKEFVTSDDVEDKVAAGALMLGYSPYTVNEKILSD